jgi:SAM-dependent methyltransferase
MHEHQQTLYVGAPRGAPLKKTVNVITGKLRRLGRLSGERLLDVGCGDGTFTRVLGARFREICGIDVQDVYLDQFRVAVKGDARFVIANMSASEMRFPNDHFDTVITIETLEHIPNLNGAAAEICRVLRRGGELLITVPNRWFPFENHGARIGRWHWGGRVPLLTYWPWLHRRAALARVFRIRDLDSLFATRGLESTAVDYAWPTFEHGGNPFQPFLKPLFGLMRKAEESPLRMFGSSVIVRYVKP